MTNPPPSLTNNDAHRGVFIDFEGTAIDPPSLLGIYVPETGHFDQPVIEQALWPAASIPSQPTVGRVAPRACTLTNALHDIKTQAISERRRCFAFSNHELDVIHEATAGDPWWDDNVINVAPLAKRWKRTTYPNVTFVRDARRGRHTLDQYLQLINYPVPPAFGPGNSAQRIRHVRRAALAASSDTVNFTRTQKAKWTKALQHNWFDCAGLHALTTAITATSTHCTDDAFTNNCS